jgi:PERQ amino acid-rich with GYF domain-containing protein
VNFLLSLEAPYEIEEYIKMYLGDNFQTMEFIKKYFEQRALYRNKKKAQEDDLCVPAKAINPTSAQAEAEKRGRKKRGKAVKMDANNLGFKATASSTRIVGEIDKDY